MGLPFTYRGMTLVDGSFSVRGIHIGLDTYKRREEGNDKVDILWNYYVMKAHGMFKGKTNCHGVFLLYANSSNEFHLIDPLYTAKCTIVRKIP